MGTYYAVNYTKKYVTVPPVYVSAAYQGDTVTMMDTVETLTATGLTASTFNFFKPPAGYRWNGVGTIYCDALGGATTLSVGTSATDYARTGVSVNWATKTPAVAVVNSFLAAFSSVSAVKTSLGPIAAIDVLMYEFDGGTTVTVTSTDTMDTAKTITLVMEFVKQ